MKKIIGIALCFVILLTFSSCKKTADNFSSAPNTAGKAVSSDSMNESSSVNTSSEETVTSDISSVTSPSSSKESKPKNSSKSSASQSTAASSRVQNSTQTPVSSQVINSSVEEEIEENLPGVVGGDEAGSDLVLGEDYGAYLYEGIFVNFVTDKNIVYFIFKFPHTIVAYDTDKLELVYSMPLSGRPAEIQVDGDNLLISYPDLKCIRVYNKKTLTEIRSISLPNVVSSFCIDGDIVYYSEDDQHCKVYRTDLSKSEDNTVAISGKTFYFPKLLLNREKGLLYIGESHSTGSALHYYNTSDLSLHSKFLKDNYGIMNQKRTMYLVNGNVFWGGLRFNSDNAENIVGEYGGGCTHFADKNFVITGNGIYETDTYLYLGDTQGSVRMAVTDNKALVAVYQTNPGNVVVAIPY